MLLRLVRVTLPLAGVVILANGLMAAVYARELAGWGWGPAVGAPGSYWALLFGLLGLNNGLALAAFAGWVAALRREQQAQADLRAAVRWAAIPLHWDARLWLDTPPPAARPRPLLAWDWHLPHMAGFLLALALPAVLVGLLNF